MNKLYMLRVYWVIFTPTDANSDSNDDDKNDNDHSSNDRDDNLPVDVSLLALQGPHGVHGYILHLQLHHVSTAADPGST